MNEEIKKKILEVCHIEGDFLLRSGERSKEYFDKYLFESNPLLLKEIAKEVKNLIPKNIDIIAGLEMGGIPIATAISIETGIPLVFVRKKAKEYGTQKLVEGVEIKGKKILVIEDVITSGGQVIESVNEMKKLGAQIDNVFCVINRGKEKSIEKLQENNLSLINLI